MSSVFSTVIDEIREHFGFPTSLAHVLSIYPRLRIKLDAQVIGIDASKVPRWHELGRFHNLHYTSRRQGELLGWHSEGGSWRSFQVIRSEYTQLDQCEVADPWSCDLNCIDGFSASKADLTAFDSTDAMAEARCRNLISEISPEQLARNLAHCDARIFRLPHSSAEFTRYLWDGRLWLINADGSHHTAAAIYIARRLHIPVPVTGKLYTYSLNPSAVASLRRSFAMFVVNFEDPEAGNAFHDAMMAVKATWLWHPLRRPYENARAVLLPRSDARSMRVAELLHESGFAELGEYLSSRCMRQAA